MSSLFNVTPYRFSDATEAAFGYSTGNASLTQQQELRRMINVEPFASAHLPGVTAGNVDPVGRLIVTAGELQSARYNKPPRWAGINHWIGHGQSPMEGAHGNPAISLSQPYSNKMFNSGVLTRPPPSRLYVDPTSLVPLVENDDDAGTGPGTGIGETPISGFLNELSRLLYASDGLDPATHIFLGSSAARGGQNIGTLTSSGDWTRFLAQMAAGKVRARALGTNYSCHGVLWEQGEADVTTTFTTYATLLDRAQQKSQRWAAILSGYSAWLPWLCILCPDQAVVGTQGSLRGLYEARNRNQNIIIAASKYAFSYNQNSQQFMDTDDVHSLALGAKLRGANYARIAREVVMRGNRSWRGLEMKSIRVSGSDIFVTFYVPVPPIRINTTLMGAVANYGAKATDATGVLTINSVTVENHESVRISCNRTVGGAGVVSFGLSAGYTGYTNSNAGATNICDSDPTKITHSGYDYEIPHWLLNGDMAFSTY